MTARVVLLLAAAALAAANPCAAAVKAVDDTGREVVLPRPAQRIVSLAPHATEMLFAAGAGAAVVGVVAHSDWPAAARALPRVGDAAALDLERIVALAPDLIVAWPYTASPQLAALRAQNIPVFVSDPKTIAGIADDVDRLGALAGTAARGARRRPRRCAGSARRSSRSTRARRGCACSTRCGTSRCTRSAAATSSPRRSGRAAATTCSRALTLPAPSVTIEAVVAARPDVIVGGDDDGRRPAWLDAWKRWPGVPAVRDDNLFAADGNLLHRPGPRFLEGVAVLCADFERARARRARR